MALSRTLLKELTLIGRGEFGDVMVAKVSENHLFLGEKAAKRISESATKEDKQEDQPATKEVAVLVKILTQTKDENCLTEFKREIDMFSKLTHEHITKLFGLCREQEPHYLIMEHTEWVRLEMSFWANCNFVLRFISRREFFKDVLVKTEKTTIVS